MPCSRIEVLEASHPVPDAAGLAASRRILSRLDGLKADDLVVALISGGGSALLALPGGDLTLDDLKAVNAALLASGADITAMNCVRKHVSAIAGGRLAAAAHPAKLVTIAISDVPGDDPAVIAPAPRSPTRRRARKPSPSSAATAWTCPPPSWRISKARCARA